MRPKMWCVLTIVNKCVFFWAFHPERIKAFVIAEKAMASKNVEAPTFCMDIFSDEKEMQVKRYTNWMLRHGIPECDVRAVLATTFQGLRDTLQRVSKQQKSNGG